MVNKTSSNKAFSATAAPAETRPASLWPETTRPGDLRSTQQFAITHFDPLADDRGKLDEQALAAFDVCHPALALRAVLLVQAVLAIVALGGADGVFDWGMRQAAAAFAGAAATVLWLVSVCALKPLLRKAGSPQRAALVVAIGATAALLGWLPLWALQLSDAAGGLRVAGVALAGSGLAALLWAWLGLRARIWHPAQTHARLAELQSRIRPHFLFNALNTALALVRVNPGQAESVLEDLSELFRVALAETGSSVSLDEEIDLAKRYLAIEQIRFGQRMKVNWDLDPRVGAARVPPLMLQPLVENAVRHGIEPANAGGQLWVKAALRRGQATLLVSNTVPPEPSIPGHGIALQNVRERLRLLHDVAAQCDVWREGDVFHVRVVLPL